MRRFYCEFCGGEVRETDDVCPHCGSFFVAIRCPQCGYRGKMHQFREGCPSCGYLSQDEDFDLDVGRHERARRRLRPDWLFLLVLGILLVSFAVLALLYMRL